MTTQEKIKEIRKRFEEGKLYQATRYKSCADTILSFIQEELTTQKKEIVEMIDGMERSDRTLDGFSGEVSTTRIEGYNNALKDIKSKINNETL